jgi:membrane-associated phospholipid phosphatase
MVIVLIYFFPSMLMIRPENRLVILGLIFVFTFILPALNVLMLLSFGNISNLTLTDRTERIVPFVFISILYILVTFLFYYKLPFSSNFNRLMLIITCMVIVSLLITFFYKISIHSLAICGAIGILLPLNKVVEQADLLWPTVVTILVAGVVMSARLLIGAHSPREVMYGSLVGFIIGFCGMIILF